MATTLREALKSRRIAQDAKKPFDRPKDTVAMHRHMAIMKRGQSEHRDTYSEAHMTKDYTPERHVKQAQAHLQAASTRPEYADHHKAMAQKHLGLASRKLGQVPAVKVKG